MTVYFARVGRYVKIGHSASPCLRALDKAPGAAKPDDFDYRAPVELLALAHGNRPEEQRIHAALDDHRMCGEWFADCQPVRDFIANYRAEVKRAAQLERVYDHRPVCECEVQHVVPMDTRSPVTCEDHDDPERWDGPVVSAYRRAQHGALAATFGSDADYDTEFKRLLRDEALKLQAAGLLARSP